MSILTTTIGAYPKPKDTPVPDWFESGTATYGSSPTKKWNTAMANLGGNLDAAFEKSTKEVITDQVNVGIDIPTDGEVRRDNYIYYHCRQLEGIDFKSMSAKSFRDGAEMGMVPTVRKKIKARHKFLVNDWKFAQSFSDKPIKITMPGPLTVSDTVVDDYYNDRQRLGADFADALNHEVLELARCGCKHIQMDEPVFVRQLDNALDFGFENIDRAFHNCPKYVTRTVHMCCSYPDRLDNPNYMKGPPDSYSQLVDAIEDSSIMAVSIEHAHEHIDLSILEKLRTTKAIIGVVAIGKSRIESVEEIQEEIRNALAYIDANRLLVSPDCGLGLLGRELTLEKLKNMSAAAHSVSV